VRASSLKASMQLVISAGNPSEGAAAAAVAIAGSLAGPGSLKKRGSISGADVVAVKRDDNGMIANPLLRMQQAQKTKDL
jgi:hypothetical protein